MDNALQYRRATQTKLRGQVCTPRKLACCMADSLNLPRAQPMGMALSFMSKCGQLVARGET